MLRNVLSKLANRQYLLINFLEAPLLALIIGYFTKYISDPSPGGTYVFRDNENLPAYLFMSVVVALFMGLMVSAEEIIRDRKIRERESFLRLSWLSYLHSKIVVLFCISAIQTFSYVLVGNLILEIKGMMLSYWLILFTASCLANMIGLNISSGLNSVVTIYIIIPFILVPQLLFSGVIVDYDKLHKIWRNPEYVPVIGDVMTSRWAYEAMVVDQFKSNKFHRNFFDIEMRKNNASYNKELVDALLNKVNDADFLIKKDTNLEQAVKNLELVRFEMNNLASRGIIEPFADLDSLLYGSFNQQVYLSVSEHLNQAKSQFVKVGNAALYKRDEINDELILELGSKDAFIDLEDDYYNDRLAEIVLNKKEIKSMIEIDNRIIRRKTPVYMMPLSPFGRAHFYAPVKVLGNLSIDTYLFNLMVIWFSTLLFYLTLVFDVLRRLIDWAERIKLSRKLKL
jgi:hypothetical protein